MVLVITLFFLECVDNNKATTIHECFMSAVQKYGTPLRVRCDQGLENLKIAEYMLHVRSANSVIAGKITHNQRIERLWGDVYEGVLMYFCDSFHFMEVKAILDPLSDLHLFALHYVCQRKINEKLNIWKNAWCNHRIRTVKSSPLRLFTAGAKNIPVEQPQREQPVASDNDNANLLFEGDMYRPMLNPSSFPISERCKEQLLLQCHQNWVSENHGIDIFQKVLEIIDRL